MPEKPLKIEDHPDEADLKFLEDSLIRFNLNKTGMFDDRNLAIFIRDENGRIIAGLSGWTWGGCLQVEYLWVQEDQRHQGYGKRLLEAAEKEAIARQCFQAILDTHSFQAPDFYQKLGYEIAGIIKDHPKGSNNYLLRKSLV
jgi:ribosomal protein S18 acetylase RimI-like enzyme